MKLLTLNTHSIIQPDYEVACDNFARVVGDIRPDIITLQEVNQSMNASVVSAPSSLYHPPCGGCVPLKADNHLLRILPKLEKMDLHYHLTWLPVKTGYDRFDEGIAILAKSPIIDTSVCFVSHGDDREAWQTRAILGVRVKDTPQTWVYSVHYGWWRAERYPFDEQWQRTLAFIQGKEDIILAGDFNNPADLAGEGYEMVRNSGFHDTYHLAKVKWGYATVPQADGDIDGWHDRDIPQGGMRIDQIWTRYPHEVLYSRVIFDGQDTPRVSDHLGVLTDIIIKSK